MTTRSKRGNEGVGEISATEALSELSSKLLLKVSSIESTNEELMYTIRRENQMTYEVMQTLIEETKRATNVTKALLEKNSTTITTTVQQCKNELKTEFSEAIAATLTIQNNKDEVKNAKKNMEETGNDKLKKRDDIFWRYYRNKRLNELFREELEKENPMLPGRFQIKQRECEADEEYKIRKEFGKESLKTELKLLQVRFIQQQKFIMDTDIDMTNCIRNQHTEDIAVNLIQQWKKECQMAEERTKARFTQKEKWFKENWNLEYKPRTDDENKTNLQQHKDLESGSRKPNRISRDFFKLHKRKSEEETNRNIRSSSERLNITNDPLLPMLTSLETETTTETNDATEEPIEADFLEELQSHTRGT